MPCLLLLSAYFLNLNITMCLIIPSYLFRFIPLFDVYNGFPARLLHLSITRLMVTRKRAMRIQPSRVSITVKNS